MSNNKYLEDLNEIKNLMNRSSRFLSLSGLSGIFAGLYALGGAFVAHQLLFDKTIYLAEYGAETKNLIVQIVMIAVLTAILAVGTALIFTRNKAKKNNEQIWDETTRRLLIHFLIPLVTGGVFGLILLKHGFFVIVPPITLIFYGLALVNASKFTLDTVKYLGISQIVVGLIATWYVGYGLYFWAFGFGVLHIVYGSIMYLKERKASH